MKRLIFGNVITAKSVSIFEISISVPTTAQSDGQGDKRTPQSRDFFHKAHTHLVDKTLSSSKKNSSCAVLTLHS